MQMSKLQLHNFKQMTSFPWAFASAYVKEAQKFLPVRIAGWFKSDSGCKKLTDNERATKYRDGYNE